MNAFYVKPFVGVNNIEFGMNPPSVRELLSNNFESFKRSEESAYPCDFFEEIGVFAYYDSKGCLEALEFASPSSVVWSEVDFLNTSADRIRDLLQSNDADTETELDGVTSYKHGLGIYAPNLTDDPKCSPESVIVFAEHYYN